MEIRAIEQSQTTKATPRVASNFEDGLDFLWLELTPKCNLNCVHCYADSSPFRPLYEKMRFQDWIETLEQAAALGCRRVQFIGGEPTLYPYLDTLIESARSLGVEMIEVFTNGTVLTQKLKNAFIQNRVNLAFSVYDDRAAVHDAITQNEGSFSRTLSTIMWAVSSGLSVRVGVIAMETNSDHLEHTRKMLESIGVAAIDLDRIRGIGRGAHEDQRRSKVEELCGQCWKGKLCVSSNGQIYPCVFSRFCPVSEAKHGLATALASAELHSFRETVKLMQQSKIESLKECDPYSPPVCKPDRPVCNPDLPDCDPTRRVCEPYSPPVCKPDRPVCTPDLPSPVKPG